MEDCDVERSLKNIYQCLQNLVGLHRQLLETVRLEKEALISADLKNIQDITFRKETLIAAIHAEESERRRHVAGLSVDWREPVRELTLSRIIERVQGNDLRTGDLFRSVLTTLTLLVQRITDQNAENSRMVEKSLEHVANMKTNVLGEAAKGSDTYAKSGKKQGSASKSRLVSKEV